MVGGIAKTGTWGRSWLKFVSVDGWCERVAEATEDSKGGVVRLFLIENVSGGF